MYRTAVLGFFVFALTAAELPRLRFAVPIPGGDQDAVAGMATDSAGNIYIAANTKSLDLPTTPNAMQPTPRASGLYRLRTSAEPLTGNGSLSTVLGLAAGELPAVVYAATAGGLVKSTDGGDTWAQTGPFRNHRVNSVATAPSLPSVVYAASELGLFRSGDSGGNWADVTPPRLAAVFASQIAVPLFVSPTDPNIVFAGYSNYYRTTDGGQSWTSLQFVTFGPTTFDSKGNLYVLGSDRGVEGFYRTTDLGVTWQRLSSGPDPIATYALLGGPDAATLYGGGFSGVFRSTNSGVTWTKLNSGVTVGIAASPDFSALYQITAKTIFRSLDAGVTWTALPLPAPVQSTVLATAGAFFSAAIMPNLIYVAKLDASANVVYGTYFGGIEGDTVSGIDVDSGGNAWIAGQANSTGFPITSFSPGTPNFGPFVARINSNGSKPLFSVIRPGSSISGLSVAPDGSAYLAEIGTVRMIIPCQPGPSVCPPTQYANSVIHISSLGASDWSASLVSGFTSLASAATVVKVAPGGGVAVAYAGGNFSLYSASGKAGASVQIAGFTPTALAFDAAGNLLAGGSAQANAKASAGAFQTAPRFTLPFLPSEGSLSYVAPQDGFAAKLAPDLSVIWATRYGGESQTSVTAIAADAGGNVFIGGDTTAHALSGRVPLQGFFSPTRTGFVAKLNGQGSQLVWSSYVGDSRPFSVGGLVVDKAGNCVLAGHTFDSRADTGIPPLYPGSDIFVASIGLGDPAPRVTLDAVINIASRRTTALSPGGLYAVQGAGFDVASTMVWFDGEAVTPFLSATGEIAVKVPGSIAGRSVVAVRVEAAGTTSNSIVMPAAPAAPAFYTVDGSGVGQAVVYNEDGSANSSTNPAVSGSTVTLLLNGVTDQQLGVSIMFGARVTEVRMVEGVTQIKARIPDIFTNSVLYSPVSVSAGGMRSQGSVYVVLK